MNKKNLVDTASQKAALSKAEMRKVINAVLELIGDALSTGDRVSIRGFGTFGTRERAVRQVRNPRTAEIIKLPAGRVPYFKAGKKLRDGVGRAVISEESSRKQLKTVVPDPLNTETGEPFKDTKKARVIAVTSGKGGTGKTTFVINIAIAMARKGLRVCIIDADLGTANVNVLLNIPCRNSINSLVENPSISLTDIITEGPEGLMLIPGGSGLQTLAVLNPEELARLITKLNTLEDLADVILIDTGAGISHNVIEFAVASDEIIVVTTPEPHSISDAYAIIKVLGAREMQPPVKLVLNQVENALEAQKVATRLVGVTERFLQAAPELLGHILRDENMIRSIKQRKPLIISNPTAPSARCLNSLADKIIAGSGNDFPLAEEKNGFFSRLKSLLADSKPEEVEILFENIGTRVASFFSEAEHLNYLADHYIPDLIASAEGQPPAFRAWSADCSTGEDPYTLAMFLERFIIKDREGKASILATDSNTEALVKAKNGIYCKKELEGIPYDYLTEYFQLGQGSNSSLFKVKSKLQQMVTFRRFNLAKPETMQKNLYLDLIICRDVLTNYDPGVREKVLTMFYKSLKPGGLLFISSLEVIESTINPNQNWQIVDHGIYCRMK